LVADELEARSVHTTNSEHYGAGKPVARLTPIVATESRSGVRYGGISYKKLKLSGDFHTALTGDDLLNT
jgi:hypothetical protein